MSAILIVAAMFAAGPTDATVNKTEVVRDVASCLSRQADGQSKRLLATRPGGDEEQRVGRDLLFGHSACIGERRAFSVNLAVIRGALAEIAFERSPALLDAVAAAAAVSPARLPNGISVGAFRPTFAACVAAAAPGKTAAVFRTAQGSQQERGALLAMGETLMACLPTDVTYHLKADELRPYLAAALYYDSLAPKKESAR